MRNQRTEFCPVAAIANSYSSIKESSSWIASKQFDVRWFHFGFDRIVYNLCLLTDFSSKSELI